MSICGPMSSSRARVTSIGNCFTRCVPTTTSIELRALQERRTFLLRDAAGDGDDRGVPHRPGGLAELAEPREQLVFGPLPHAAGVDDDDVGVGGVGRRLEPGGFEEAGEPLAVVHVHLTAVGLNQILSRHVPCLCGRRCGRHFRFRLLPPLRFRPADFRFRPSPGSTAWRRRASLAFEASRARAPSSIGAEVSPAIMRASSSTRRIALEGRRRRQRPPGDDPLADVDVRVGVGGDLRQVGDAQHLGAAATGPAAGRRPSRPLARRCRRRPRRR